MRLAKQTSNLFRRHDRGRAGLDVSGLAGVISIDPQSGTADVQGMCTYETLVAVTCAQGFMPLVVPQLKTITLGGAVTGLGIESTSLFNGLPHESVLEMDILLGTGQVLSVSPTENSDLFRAFPNSYGSLGYAVRLRIVLQPVAEMVALRHVRFSDLEELASAVEVIAAERAWDAEPVDFVDGVMFSPVESYLTLGSWTDVGRPSDYTGQQIFYRSIRERERDCLTTADYLWRWDTDWFWCSGAFGAQHPLVRRIWPRRLRRSDVYHRLVALEGRFDVAARVARWGKQPPRERVVQDIEVPLGRTAQFLRWFHSEVGMTPVWLCPLRSQESWPLYPLEPGQIYVNVGFWGTVPIRDGARDGDVNRAIERAVADIGGHKSLYSDAFYDRETFDALYGAAAYESAKLRYDPQDRFTGMYEKVVGTR
ncbi:MAG: FAD-binding oxidoreductase [Pseudonocardiales bacterium]